MINWHRLLGLTLEDYFHDSPYRVELEKDLAAKRQLLDVVIIGRKDCYIEGPGAPWADVCDGFEGLRRHNLLTYKSHHEPLGAWVVAELIGHYVNYRKGFAAEAPEADFGLYAVATRYPRDWAKQVDLEEIKPGIFRHRLIAIDQWLTVIVLGRIGMEQRNALWELFSHEQQRILHGVKNYRWKVSSHNAILNQLYHRYRQEGIVPMSYTIEDLRQDVAVEVLHEHPELLEKIPPKDRLKGLRPEDRLKGLRPEDRLKGLRPEDRLKGLRPEDRLKGLNEDELVRLRRLLAGKSAGELH